MTKTYKSKISKMLLYVLLIFLALIVLFAFSPKSKITANAYSFSGSYANFGGGDNRGQGSVFSTINSVGKTNLAVDCEMGGKWFYHQSSGAASDIKSSYNHIKLDQGSSSGDRNAVIFTTIQLHNSVTKAIASGNVEMTFESKTYTSGDNKEFSIFIDWGHGDTSLDGFTSVATKVSPGSSSENSENLMSVSIGVKKTSVTAVRVGIQVKKWGFLRHMEVYAHQMALTVKVNGTVIRPTAASKTYDGQIVPIGWDATPKILAGNTFTPSYSGSGVNVKNAGDYNLSLNGSIDGGSYYPITFASAISFSISKRPVTVTPSDREKTYGDADPILNWSAGGQGIVQGEALAGALTREAGENVGSYKIEQGDLNNASNPNYDITFDSERKLTINKRSLAVSIVNRTITYGDTDVSLIVTPTKPSTSWAAGSGTWDEVDTSSLTRTGNRNAGTYTISKGSNFDNNNLNYNITVSNDGSATYVIEKRNVTIAAPNGRYKTYWEYPRSNEEYEAIIEYNPSFIPENAGAGIVAVSGALTREPGEDVGLYNILQGTYVETNGDNKNYNITYAGAKFKIKPFEMYVTPRTEQSKIYGENDPISFAYTHKPYPTGAGETGYSLLVGELGRKPGNNVGFYEYTLGTFEIAENNPNYIITMNVPPNSEVHKFEIKKKPINVAIKNITTTYNNTATELDYKNMLVVVTPAAGVLEYSDTLEVLGINLTKAPGLKAGSYVISGTASTVGNYTVSLTNGTFKINKATRTIDTSAMPIEVTYDGVFHTIAQGAKFSIDELQGFIDTNIVYTNNTFRDVPANGKLEVKLNANESENYITTTKIHTVTIKKVDLTITISNSSSVYKEELSNLDSSLTSGELANREGSQDVGKTYQNVLNLSLSTTATSSSNAGTYPITASYSNGNYNVTVVNGTYTIIKAQSVINGSLGSYTFNGQEQTIAGYGFNNTDTGAKIEYSNNKFTDVPLDGKVTIKYWVLETTNYFGISEKSVVVNINKAETNINTNGVNLTYTYTGFNQTVNSGASTNQIGTSGVSVAEIKYLNNTFKDVPSNGKKAITIYTESTQNYLAQSVEVEITINKANINASVINMSKIYGDNDPSFDFNVTGLLGSDTKEGLGILLERVENQNVGTYEISKKSQTNGNYNVIMQNGILTINQRAITVNIRNHQSVYRQPEVILQAPSIGSNPEAVEEENLLTQLRYSDRIIDLRIILQRENSENKNVGTYAIIPSQESDASGNYLVSFSGAYGDGQQGKGIYEIVKAQRKIDLSGVETIYTYNGEEQIVSGAILTPENLDPDEDQSILNVSNNKFTDVPENGRQTVTFSVGDQNNNYLAVTENVTVFIKKYEVKIEIRDVITKYKQEPVVLNEEHWYINESTPMLGGEENASILDISLNAMVTNQTTVGIYPISGAWTQSAEIRKNYNVVFHGTQGEMNGRYIIERANPKVNINIGEYTYNGSEQIVRGISVVESEKPLNILYNSNIFKDVPNDDGVPGKLVIRYTIEESTNYNKLDTTVAVYIKKAATIINTDSMTKTYTYDGNIHTIEGASNNHSGTFKSNITYQNNSFRNVPGLGYLDVVVKSAANNNYLGAEKVERVYINKAPLALVIEDKEGEYGDNIKPLTARLGDDSILKGDDKIEYIGYTLEKAEGRDVGQYIISSKGYTNKNYDVTFENGTYNILPKNISVTIANKESAYKEALVPLTWSLSFGNAMAYGESTSLLDISLEKEEGLYAGEYQISGVVGQSTSTNYNVSFVKGKYRITRINRSIDTSAMILNRTYNGTLQVVEGATLSEADPTGDPSIIYQNNTFKDVPESGIQRIDLSVEASRNYNSAAAFVILNISKYHTTVDIENKESEYKSDTVALSATCGTLAGSDDNSVLNLNLSTEASKEKDAGQYIITATYSNPNYDVIINHGIYTITKAPLAVFADEKNTTYGSPVTLTYKIVGNFKEGDDESCLNIVLQRSLGQNVGNYEITLKSYIDTNYDLTFTSAQYIISPKEINVLIDSKQSAYGRTLLPLTFSVSGNTPLEYGQSPDVLGVKLEKAPGINTGVYEINASKQNGSNNYHLTFSGELGEKGKYEITKTDTQIDVTTIPKVYVFTNEVQTVVGNPSIILNQTGDYIDTLEYENNTFKDVPVTEDGMAYGIQVVTVRASGNQNYNPKEVSFEITIYKAETTIDASGIVKEYTYNGEEQTVEGSAITNQVGEYLSNINYVNNKFVNVPVANIDSTFGTQQITIQVLGSRNYLPKTQNVEIKINKAETIIDTSKMIQSYTYNTYQQEILGATLNHSETGIIYQNNKFKNVPAEGYINVSMKTLPTRNYLAASTVKQIEIKKAKQIINVSEVKREYKKSIDTLPIVINSGASVEDQEQVVQYENNVYYAWEGTDGIDGATLRVFAEETSNYLETEAFVILLVDKIVSVIDVSNVVKNYVYTGSLITINTGARLTVGDAEHQPIQWENNTFTTVSEGRALEVRVFVDAYGEYSASEVRFNINVEKAESILEIDASALNFTYTGLTQSIDAVRLVNHNESEVQWENNIFTTVSEALALNARAFVQESENYKANSIENIKVNIEKATTIIDSSGMQTDFVYTGFLQESTGATINHSESEVIYANNTFITVADGNEKHAEIIVPESENYKAATDFVILNVQKATYDMSGVSLLDKTVDYTGEKHSLAINGSLPDGVSVIYSTANQVNAGIYDVTATFSGDLANYKPIEKMNAVLTINKIDYDFDGITFESKQKVYNGRYQSLKIEGVLPLGLDNIRPNVVYSGQRKDVGITNIQAAFSTNSNNYNIPSGFAVMNADLEIVPLEIIIEMGAKRPSVESENIDSFELSSANFNIVNKSSGDIINLTYTSEIFADVEGPVGKAFAKMVVTSLDNSNYKLPSNPEILLDAAIIYPIDIDIATESLAYDGSPKQFEVVSTINGVVVPHSVAFRQGYREYATAIDAGVYTMIVTVIDEYAGKKVEEQPMQINRLQATLSIEGAFTQTYGSFEIFRANLETPYEFDGSADIEMKYSFTGAMPDAGNHTVTAHFRGSKNYEEVSITKPFIVEKKKITLFISEENEYVYTGERQSIRYRLSSFSSNDSNIVTLNYGENNPSGIGRYDINVTLNNPNYILESVVGPLEMYITKAPLEIFVTYTYGIENKAIDFKFDYVGFVPGESEKDLATLPVVEKKTYKAGTYQIQASGVSSNNYEVTYVPFTLEVYRENLERITDKEEVIVTGIYDGSSSISVEQVAGDVFFDNLFKLANSVTVAYKVEVIGTQNTEIDNTPRKVLIKNDDIKLSPFVGAYFVDGSGNKHKLSRSDIKNGYIETSFDIDNGFIVVYKNHLLWLILGITAIVLIIIAIVSTKLYRKSGSRYSSKYKWLD